MKWILDELVQMGLGVWSEPNIFKTAYDGYLITDYIVPLKGKFGDYIGVDGKVRKESTEIVFDYPTFSFLDVPADKWAMLRLSMMMEIRDVWENVLGKKIYRKIKRRVRLTFDESGFWSKSDSEMVVNIDPYAMFRMVACVAYYDKKFKMSYLVSTVEFVIEHELTHLIEEHAVSMLPLNQMERRALNVMMDMDINLGLSFRRRDLSSVLMGLGVFTHLPIGGMREEVWEFVESLFFVVFGWCPGYEQANELYLDMINVVRQFGKLETFRRLVKLLEFMDKESILIIKDRVVFGQTGEDLNDSNEEFSGNSVAGDSLGTEIVDLPFDEKGFQESLDSDIIDLAILDKLEDFTNLNLSDRYFSGELIVCDIPKFSEIIKHLMRKTSDSNVRFSDEVLSRRLEGVWGEEVDVFDRSNKILFLFDTSGSMNANSMVQAMSVFVYAISNRVFYGVNKFYVGCWSDDLVLLEQVKAKSKDAMINKTHEIVERGLQLGFNNCLLTSMKTLKSKLKKPDLIIHISDGEFYGFTDVEYLEYTENMVNVIVGEKKNDRTTFERTHGGGIFVQGG